MSDVGSKTNRSNLNALRAWAKICRGIADVLEKDARRYRAEADKADREAKLMQRTHEEDEFQRFMFGLLSLLFIVFVFFVVIAG